LIAGWQLPGVRALKLFGVVKDRVTRAELMVTYRPILRGAGYAGIFYFTVNGLMKLFLSGAPEANILGFVSLGFAAFCALIWWLAKRVKTHSGLELCGLALCSSLIVNVSIHMSITFEQENMAYFVLVMPVCACVNVTRRAFAVGMLGSFFALLWFVSQNIPSHLTDYISVGAAGILVSLGVSVLVRDSIINAVRAQIAANDERERAVNLATQDPLTVLPNRRSFFQALEDRDQRLHQSCEGFVLGLIDLDGFKPVNDTYGHAAGDQLLREVGRRLGDAVPDGALIARLGGDEFAVLADLPGPGKSVDRFGNQITRSLGRPYEVEGNVADVGASMGLLVCDEAGPSQKQMMERADHALYVAKRSRRGGAVVFSAHHESDLLSLGRVEQALRESDLDTELSLLFQPQYDLHERRVVGFEALARWTSPSLGVVMPDLFIPAAERACVMRPITQILLAKTLVALERLPQPLRISFNLSVHDLMSPAAVEHILTQVRESGVDPARLEFEIAETALAVDFNMARTAITNLRQAGCSVSLDDFGVGYTNVSHLQQLSISKLKVDRSFIAPLLDDESAAQLVRTLINLARSLDLECVLEGVESFEQLSLLDAFNARYVQGYLIARPMSVERIETYLAAVEAGETDFTSLPPAASAVPKAHKA
tara:strand:- start:86703 stop:88667 length:1965 start_codon:yes stop_codon:yes gene_type:complete